MAVALLKKLPKLPNQYAINFVLDYYRKLIQYLKISTVEDPLLKLLKNIEVTNVA